MLLADTIVDDIDTIKSPSTQTPPAHLASFQHRFGQYLRSGALNPNEINPSQINSPIFPVKRVTALYKQLVFNNVRGFLDRCFPVCQNVISAEDWLQVCEHFFETHDCHSPYFTEINQSFVSFLAKSCVIESLDLPPYFAELAHYEWIELAVDTCGDDHTNDPTGLDTDKITDKLTVNASVHNLHYTWPVHLIDKDTTSLTPEDSFFLVFRHPKSNNVQFMQTNALTYALIDFLTAHPISLTQQGLTGALMEFANMLGYEDSHTLVDFGLPLLQQLSEQHVLHPTFQIDQIPSTV